MERVTEGTLKEPAGMYTKCNNDTMQVDNNEVFEKRRGVYLRPYESLNLFVSPEKYIMSTPCFVPRAFNLPYTQKQLYLVLLQDTVHRWLEAFLNSSDLDRSSTLTGGVYERCCTRNMDSTFVLYLTDGLLKYDVANDGLMAFRKAVADMAGRRTRKPTHLARTLALFYKQLPVLMQRVQIEKAKLPERTIPPPTPLSVTRAYEEPYYTALKKIQGCFNKKLSSLLAGAYLHGSMVTMDYAPGCSDVDMLIIPREETAGNKDTLLELRYLLRPVLKAFYQADPLQHHGVQVVTESDMRFYPQPFFPLVLFDFSRTVVGNGTSLCFYERNSLLERAHTLWNMCYMFRRAYVTQTVPVLSYDWKLFLQVLLLLPALYLQLREEYCYKKFSYERVKPHLSPGVWRVIDCASRARMHNLYIVNKKLMFHYSKMIYLAPFTSVKALLQRIFAQPSQELFTITGSDFLKESFEFAEQTLYLSRDVMFGKPIPLFLKDRGNA